MVRSSHGRPDRSYVISVAYTHAPTDPRVRRHCEALARRGYRVIQLGIGAPQESAVGRLNGVILLRWKNPRYRGSRLIKYAAAYARFLVWARRLVRRISRERRVLVVQANNMPNFAVWAATPARRYGAGVILDIHDPVPELFASKFGHYPLAQVAAHLLRLEESISGRAADLLLCVNETHRKLTVSHGSPASKIRVVVNAADEGLFPRRVPREPIPFVAYHGTVAARLGLDVLVEAVRRVIDSGQSLRGAIWGDGDAVPALLDLRRQLRLENALELPGVRFRPEDLRNRLDRVGIGVVTIRRDPSTDVMLPTKLIEYVRLGIPVLVTWTPTIAEYFPEDSVTYVRDFSPETLASGICAILADPVDARGKAERAQSLPIARGWREIEQDYIDIVEEIGFERQNH